MASTELLDTRRRIRSAAVLVAAVVALAAGIANAVVLAGGSPRPLGKDPADCALVLGAGLLPDGSPYGAPSSVLADRLTEALSLYEAGRVKTILVSGDHRTERYDEPDAMRLWLEARGVPPSVIFMDHAGVDTYSSVWRARHVFGSDRVIVVTQRFHLPRALWVARSLGMEAEGAVADRRFYRGAAWFEARELVSRTKAVIDVVAKRRPHHVGRPISLADDGRVTCPTCSALPVR